MDRSLWLLLDLRLTSWLRRWTRSLGTLKGMLLALVGSLVFLPLFVSALLAPRLHLAAQLEAIRQHGAPGLLAYCLLTVVLSAGERAVSFSPAEIDFLFPGPYRQRQLLIYKVVGSLGGALLSALFLTLVLGHHAASRLAAFVGLFLAVVLLNLFSLAFGLLAGMAGALAFDRARKGVLVAFAILVGGTLWPLARGAPGLDPWEWLGRVERSPVVYAASLPIQPFVLAFAAERTWPDLAEWSALGLLVDLALLGLVLALNAEYYEASAAASARLYARLQRMRRGGAWTGQGKTRFGLPMLPWWGGIGPNLWRQLTTASRSLARVLAVLFLFLMPAMVFLFVSPAENPGPGIATGALSMLGGISIFAPTMVGFDFRPDVDRMEDLKVLPVKPARLVIGQLVTPVLILTAGQCLAIGGVLTLARPDASLLAATLTLVVPFNILLVGIENLYFLWFPNRMVPGIAVDFQAMGRQMLLMMAKFLSVGVVAVVAVGLGAAAYFLSGGRWAVALTVAWLAVTACALALIPLVARAFDQFDVARDRPL